MVCAERLAYRVMIVACLLMWGCVTSEGEEVMRAPQCGEPGGETACPEAEWPDWKLEDVQPQSARFGEVYGLDAFAGEPVFVAFLVGWCPYCRAQAIKLEALSREAEFAGVHFVVLHGASADNDADRQRLLRLDDDSAPRHTMVMFQDTEAVDAWGQHGGAKDDFYLYGADGKLSAYLPGGQSTNLSTPQGEVFVREALRAIAK